MRNASRAILLTVVVTCTLPLPGCGQEHPEITDQVARTLQRDVVAVKSAVDESRWEEAHTALDRFEADVTDAAASGNLSDDRAARIRTIRQRVLEDLDRITKSGSTAQPSTTPSTESTPSPKPTISKSPEPDQQDNPTGEEDKDKDGKNKSKGKGKGKGKP